MPSHPCRSIQKKKFPALRFKGDLIYKIQEGNPPVNQSSFLGFLEHWRVGAALGMFSEAAQAGSGQSRKEGGPESGRTLDTPRERRQPGRGQDTPRGREGKPRRGRDTPRGRGG